MREKRAKRDRKELAAMALLVLCALALTVGGFHLITLQREYTAGKDAYTQLYEQVQQTPTPEPVQTEEDPTQEAQPVQTPPPWPQVDFAALREINPDGVGWISIPGTGIDYPIVQGKDNKIYLKKLFTGEENRAGCIFLDSGNKADFTDPNSVVYGHHLKNGEMFSPLLNYKQQSYYDAHPTGWLVTPSKVYRIRFFSGFVSNVWGDAWNTAPTDAEGWQTEMASKSLFSGGPTPTPEDRILTLSTCSYEFSNARFLLMGVLERQK